MKKRILFITQAAVISAMYVALTLLSAAFSLDKGAIQLRLSEALCVLPVFTPAAVPGLFVGCLIANLVTGCIPWDIAIGSLATLIAAAGTRLAGRRNIFPGLLCPVAANTVAVPIVLKYFYGLDGAIWYFAVTVFAGELISAGLLGYFLYRALRRSGLFRDGESASVPNG